MIKFDITEQLDQLNKLHRDMPYIISRAMNNLAFKEGRKAVSKDMEDNFTVRNKYFSSERAVRVQKSNKNNLVVALYHFKEELKFQQFLGVETPRGKKIAVPSRANMAKYLGLPQDKTIPKNLSIQTMMQKAPSHKNKTKEYKVKGVKPFLHPKGVFIRTANGLRLIYAFVDKAVYDKKLINLQKDIEKVFNDNFEEYLNDEYVSLLKRS